MRQAYDWQDKQTQAACVLVPANQSSIIGYNRDKVSQYKV